jgi:hypothetical protein
MQALIAMKVRRQMMMRRTQMLTYIEYCHVCSARLMTTLKTI